MDINVHNVESIEITESNVMNTSKGVVYSRTMRINSSREEPDYITFYSYSPYNLTPVDIEGIV